MPIPVAVMAAGVAAKSAAPAIIKGLFSIAAIMGITSAASSYLTTGVQTKGQKAAAEAAIEAEEKKTARGMAHARGIRRRSQRAQRRLRQEIAAATRTKNKEERDLMVQLSAGTGIDEGQAQYTAIAIAELSRAIRGGMG